MIPRPRAQGDQGKSPFRYPGGKASLLPTIYEALQACGKDTNAYAEPYAGGAGAAIELLALEAIEQIHLNDADVRIFAAWKAMIDQSEEFIDRLTMTDVTIDNWHVYNKIVNSPNTARDVFELGFATFFMNRTNRSGIILGAGPIGGYQQRGTWKLDARYYRATMIKRIQWLAQYQDRIFLTNHDGVDFIRSFSASRARRTFFFIDPPYVQAGKRLYLNAMDERKHRQLAKAIKNKPSINKWLMTYDNDPLIREIYGYAIAKECTIRYSLQTKRFADEIMISPHS